MKTFAKIVLTVFTFLSFSSLALFAGSYYVGDNWYIYASRSVITAHYVCRVISVLVLAALIVLIVFLFKARKHKTRVICAVIALVFVVVSIPLSFFGLLVNVVIGPNGCSYTEDIANYGTYDYAPLISYFPEQITEDMTVVDFVYFYKYADIHQVDLYLEVKFADAATMETYLNRAIQGLEEDNKQQVQYHGTFTYPNPYDARYTDIISNECTMSTVENDYAAYIEFKSSADTSHRYIDTSYNVISYCYEDLTIIFTSMWLGSDLSVGNDPENGEYYPRYLQRFNVQFDKENDFVVFCK